MSLFAVQGVAATRRLAPDHAIQTRRRQEAEQQAAQAVVDADKKTLLMHKWEIAADQKAQYNTATRRVAEILSQEDMKLQRRRERLKKQLEDEEAALIQEAMQSVETPLEREAKMRERVKQLREQREEERRKVAEEKKRQQFLENSEKVRTVRQKQELQRVMQEREQQLALQAQRRQAEKTIDAAFTQMWLADMHAKEERERRDAAEAHQRTLEQQQILDQQCAQLATIRAREKELRKQEQEALAQRTALLAEEAAQKREMELRRQRRTRMELARYNQITVQRRAEEARKELEEDTRLLNEAIEATRGAAAAAQAHKQRIAQEMKMYQQYMDQVRAYEREREASIDAFHRSEADKAMQRLIEKLNREQAAREQLLKEVMDVRRQQVEDHLKTLEKEQQEAAEEAARISKEVEDFHSREAELATKRRAAHVQHAQQLLDQAELNRQLRAQEAQKLEDEARRLRDMDMAYEAQLAEELQRLHAEGQ